MELNKLYSDIYEFSIKVFPDAKSNDHLLKLKNEADEAIENNKDIYEFADCFIALIAASSKSGFNCDELIMATFEKLEICKSRSWKKLIDGTYQHYD